MWTTFLGKHIKLSLAEIVLALIPSRICNYQFCNRHDGLTLCNTRTVTFKLVAVKEVLVIYSVVFFVPVIHYSSFVICCAFIRQLLFVINRSFILLVVRLFILFHFH
jgi:hypothetical protein